MSVGRRPEPERGHARRDRTRHDEHDLVAGVARAVARSSASFVNAPSSSSPDSFAIDDVPTFTTETGATTPAPRRRARGRRCAPCRRRPRPRGPRPSRRPCAAGAVGCTPSPRVREIGECDRALGRAALHAPLLRALAHDGEALLLGPEHDVRLQLRPRPHGRLRSTSRAGPRNSSSPARVTLAMRSPSNSTSGARDIGLAADDEARPFQQLRPVATELVEQHPLLFRRRPAVDRREVAAGSRAPGRARCAAGTGARARGPPPRLR